ncbi:TonB-dependent receptor, partial [Pseudomonas sp. FSL R10-0071]
VARYQANLGAEWDAPMISGLTLSARAIRTGEQYIDSANTQSIDGWTRYDLGARYALKGLMDKPVLLRLAVENVLNKDYWASASTGRVSGVSRGAPRTVLVSSTFSF